MSYRTIAVHVNDSRHALKRIQIAARIAADNAAHLVGVAATGVPESFYMSGMMGEGSATLVAYLDFMKERAVTNLAAFESAVGKSGVSHERRIIEDDAGSALCLQARYSDLLVLGQTDPEESALPEPADLPDYVIANAGRPVLLVPYAGKFDSVGERALIAWDGSLEAARAVSGAIPLLRKAKLVQVAVFDPKVGLNAHGEEPGADIALYLARHGVTVEVSRRYTEGDIDIGNALLSHLDDFGADLAVMGGYGHSRFREVLLGGVTRTVLQSMTVPVLMAH
jgi:nucleotide-binding universal stress UspA family protein